MSSYYGIILVYPLISVVITRILGEQGSWIQQIKNEIWLFLGIGLIYAAIFFIMLVPQIHPSALVSFILFTIIYFAISVIRKTIFTQQQDPFIKAVDKVNL